jgi:drug/metabolite transporter (DMT)-like permease
MSWAAWNLDGQRVLGFAALGLVIIGSSFGNLLMKIGADVRDPGSLLFGLVAWQTLAGIASFGCGALAYAWALRQFDLHTAQIIISVQFIAAIVLAAFVLGERISGVQWLGIALIALGLFVSLCLE